MKYLSIISCMTFLLLVSGCVSSTYTAEIPEFTPTPNSAPPTTIPVTPTPSAVPILTDLSCQSSSNDVFYNPLMNAAEASYFPNIQIAKTCSFTGHVSKGDYYIHKISDSLTFCLYPTRAFSDSNTEGWEIFISDTKIGACNPDSPNFVNFVALVTPPFHGENGTHIFGWHFRNANNTAPNDGSVNAPQYMHDFNFMFNRTDLGILACEFFQQDSDCIIATQSSSPNTEILHSRGSLQVTKLELGNLVPSSHAWIDYMEFRVDIYLPAE